MVHENASHEKVVDSSSANVFNVEYANKFNGNDAWFADSAATEHMSMRREWFKTFHVVQYDSCKVRVDDGGLVDVLGIGDIDVRVRNLDGSYKAHTICKVWYAPKIKRNLLSIGRSSERGIRVIFAEGGKKVMFEKNGKLMVDGVRENDKLYRLNFLPVIKNTEANAIVGDSLMDWHEKLGHINFQILRRMISTNCVSDLKICNLKEDDPFYEGCTLSKQHKFSFPSDEPRRSKRPGELFHADLCGKISQSSVGGANHFLLIKDSRYCYVYSLKEKSEVF